MADTSPTTEEEMKHAMESSYSEICEEESATASSAAAALFDKAVNWVGDLSVEGLVSRQGDQVTYVASDIEEQLRRQPSLPLPPEDLAGVVAEMETDARRLASSVDGLTESLAGLLHSVSSMTVDCVSIGAEGVGQLCDSADASIRIMYQVMAKCEELSRATRPLQKLQKDIKTTRRLLEKLEAEL